MRQEVVTAVHDGKIRCQEWVAYGPEERESILENREGVAAIVAEESSRRP